MQRNIAELAENEFDVLVVGAGIHGVAVAYDAALRGLKVALIDKGDFGSATSSNSLKIVHGGLRYLQHADFRRMRESIRERKTLMRIAPHLVYPLPFLIPTYGHFVKGPEALFFAMLANDLISLDRNWGMPPDKRLPRGRVISREEMERLFPGVNQENLTGGAIWYDAQMYNSERLILAFLHSAVQAGASACNYVKAEAFDLRGDRVVGIKARDVLTDTPFSVRARLVVNTSGPWYNQILNMLGQREAPDRILLSKALNIVTRPISEGFAVGVYSRKKYKDADAVLSKGSRLFFITPWRGKSLIGTAHVAYDGNPNNFRVTRQDIDDFLREVQDAYPSAELKSDDVTFYQAGMLPITAVDPDTGDVTLAKHHRIVDHRKAHGVEGALSVIGVKYTTARDVAEKTVDLALSKLGLPRRRCVTAIAPLYGGHVDCFEDFLKNELKASDGAIPPSSLEALLRNHGSAYQRVLRYVEESPVWATLLSDDSTTIKAEVLHAVREEMAQKLADVVFRRTELGTLGYPGKAALQTAADIMANELGWSNARVQQEIAEVEAVYEPVRNDLTAKQPARDALVSESE